MRPSPLDAWYGGEETMPFAAYAMGWAADLWQKNTIGKVGMGVVVAAMARIETAFGVLLLYVIIAWAVDFLVGIARAIADPERKLRGDKARNGALRLLVIVMIAVMAAVMEGVTFQVLGWDPGGKLVSAVLVAMFWEETVSIQRNGRFFYRRLRFRLSSLRWLGNGNEKSDE